MRYNKGTFIVVPNIELLNGLPTGTQAIYIWICKYADEEGICFPSRRLLATNIGCTLRTVDKHILEEKGLLEKTKRRKPGDIQNKSNLYQIIIPEQGAIIVEQGAENDKEQGAKKDTVTISSINSIQLTEEADVVQSTEQPSESQQEVLIGQLPNTRGQTRIQRVTSIYKDVYRYKYGCLPTLRMAQVGGCIDILSEKYTELQIAAMIITFFEWKGMDGNDMFEQNKLQGAAHPFGWFYTGVDKYEVFLRNVHGLKFDDEVECRKFVGTFMVSIKNN